MKKIIITADDLGINVATNKAIADICARGVLNSSCVLSNGSSFEHAVENVISKYPKLEIGIHLNIIEGKPLIADKHGFLSGNGYFNKGFIELLLASKNPDFLEHVENEFTAQIDRALSFGIKPVCINSHVHVHSIPNIFKITCKLAQKYNIPSIRTQNEIPYYVPELSRHLNIKYPINIIKNILLNTFTKINLQTLNQYGLNTNERFIGILYTAQMDFDTIRYGLKKVKSDEVTEIILHPTLDEFKKNNFVEYKTLVSDSLINFVNDYSLEFGSWMVEE